jgi:hypothetical protein
MEGCAFCEVGTICLSCLQGYFLNTTTHICEPCTQAEGCLICRDALDCRLCDAGYYLDSFSCWNCSSVLEGCAVCSSSSQCVACLGNY